MFIYKPQLNPENIRLRNNEYSTRYLTELDTEYKKIVNIPIPKLTKEKFAEFRLTGERLNYERDYFLRRTMLRDCALKLWLGDKSAAAMLETIIEAICNEPTWILPAHENGSDLKTQIDLFAAETAHSLTEIISLTDANLCKKTREQAINAVRERVLEPFVTRKKQYGWETSKSNWSAVCGGSVGMTVLYLIEDKKEVRELLQTLQTAFECYMQSFTDDGACLEGLYYWCYGMTYFTAFLELYRERMGEKYPSDYEKIAKMADFAHKCCMSNGITVSFSDAGCRDRIYAGLSSHLTGTYNAAPIPKEYTAYFLGDDCGRWCKAARDIAWSYAASEGQLPNISLLPKAQWAVVRNGDTVFAIKGGNNAEPHNHNDIGSFIIVCGGKVLVTDLGAGEYTKDYFSDKRYSILCNRSAGHSVPLINGCEQKTGREFAAKNFECSDCAVKMDITDAYSIDNIKSIVREIKLDSNKIILTDTFILHQKTQIRERFIVNDKNCINRLSTNPEYKRETNTFEHLTHTGQAVKITAADYIFEAEGEHIFTLTIKINA